MDCNTFAALADFRHGLYACFGKARDALFNVADALLTETPARSLVELSLSPCFARRWPSLYKAFQDATIDRPALQRLFAAHAPLPADAPRLVLGVDASSIARPQSPTAKDRTYVHASNLPEGSKPVVAGWQFSALVVLPQTPSSWMYTLDNQRVPSQKTQGEVAAAQLKTLVPLLPVRPLLLADGYYGGVTFLSAVTEVACDKLLRFAKNRVLYRPAPPRTGKPGAPKKDGARFACHQPHTQGEPDARWHGEEATGQVVGVQVWHHLHFKKARALSVSVVRVERQSAANTARDPLVSWFVWQGETLPALTDIVALYRLRYGQEHGYRVDKQTLLWEQPRLRTPEQFQRWTDVVAAVRNQLVLARPLAQSLRQAWESPSREATPPQTRRAMGRIIAQLGTPACLPQVRGKAPGRPMGAKIAPVARYKVIFKAMPKARKGKPKARVKV